MEYSFFSAAAAKSMVVCRALHMFSKVSQMYHVINRLTSLRPVQIGAKDVTVF